MKKRAQKDFLKSLQWYLHKIETIEPKDPFVYCGEVHFIMKNGKFFKFHQRRSYVPNPATPVIPFQCYRNSIQHALNTGLKYVEGFAISKSKGLMDHSWCVNEFNNVRDVTWNDGILYFGVEIPIGYVIKQNDGKTDYLSCRPILQEKFIVDDGIYAKNENEINNNSKELLTGVQPYPINLKNQHYPVH